MRRTGDLSRPAAQALAGDLRSGFSRGTCWRVFLGILKGEPHSWTQQLLVSRLRYNQLRQELFVDPHARASAKDPTLDNPLSEADDSTWKMFFSNRELEENILQDLERMSALQHYAILLFFPVSQKFLSFTTIGMFSNSCFAFSLSGPRGIQTSVIVKVSTPPFDTKTFHLGMHELLGPIVMILNQEAAQRWQNEILAAVADKRYVEHDSRSAQLVLWGCFPTPK